MEFIEMFIGYTAVTLFIPAWMFRKILKKRTLSEQFLMCYTFGNFWIINIVFTVQLLHISNMFTLLLLTCVTAVLIKGFAEQVSWKESLSVYGKTHKKMIQGRLGLKTVLYEYMIQIFRQIKTLLLFWYRQLLARPIQWFLLGCLLCALFWVYGRQLILSYGYRASDIPVHLNWINEMSRDNLFSDGVYPFGFHCVIYYLHTILGIDTYVLLCQFFFVQVIYAHMAGLCVAKSFCKSKYVPYAGVFVYILGDFWQRQTYSRYYSTLPQEFGMIFVFPSIYFLIRFFQISKTELKKKETYYQLACFAMAFALTLSIHFYGTMIAGLCCVGIACGFLFRFLNKEYFCRIMLTGIISVCLAVLPMVIAFIGGTPLQGSLGWGMSVIQGTDKKNTDAESETLERQTTEILESTEQNIVSETLETVPTSQEPLETTITAVTESIEEMTEVPTQEEQEGMIEKLHRITTGAFKEFILYSEEEENLGDVILYTIAAVAGMGILHFLFGHRAYGGMLLSLAASMICITLLLCSKSLGLPTLMDSARCSIYFAYLFWLLPTLLIDSMLYMICPMRVLQIPRNILSLGVGIVVMTGLLYSGRTKQSEFSSGFVTSGAIVCLDNIIYENEDFTWTIVSANDELQMGLDHGWHYEINTFLRSMEQMTVYTKVQIPTKVVYFFIEKVPVDYATAYEDSGQTISKKGASHKLPSGGGISIYAGENRWIMMSRMYYWAEAFQKMYPNEMQVYYETETFICYKIEQNVNFLYNFAIDYGFNTVITGD